VADDKSDEEEENLMKIEERHDVLSLVCLTRAPNCVQVVRLALLPRPRKGLLPSVWNRNQGIWNKDLSPSNTK
jgi:hypothetical protein